MISKKVMIAIVALVLFVDSMASSQEYRIVKVWPEVPLGWHFYQPLAVAVDKSDNVYIGDSGNYCIKKFDSEGRFITQWGSPGSEDGQFQTITNLRVGDSGIVYVFDGDRIQKFTPYGQFIGMFERRNLDTNTTKSPIDLTIDEKGNVLVLAVIKRPESDQTHTVGIEKYSPAGEFISQWEADAGSGDGQFQFAREIAIDAKDNIYITDGGNHRVQKFDSSGKFLTKWGAFGEQDGHFSFPRSITIDESGNVYVLDKNAVQKFTPQGEFLARWEAKAGTTRIALDSHSNAYVTCWWVHAVVKFDKAGNITSEWTSAGRGDGRFLKLGSIAADPSGCIVVADSRVNCIQRFTCEGELVAKFGSGISFYIDGLSTDSSGNLYVACGGSDEIQRFDSDGRLFGRWGSRGSGDGQFQYPTAVAVGPSGNVFVVDAGNNRVQEFTSDGKFLAKWGTKGEGDGQFSYPFFIAVDASGHVWVGDQIGNNGTHRMQKFDANGKFLAKWTKRIMIPPTSIYGAVTVDSYGNSYYAFESHIEKYDAKGDLIRGYGQKEFPMDKLQEVWGMCVDKAGCLYITDRTLSIRRFDADGKLASKWTAENTGGRGGFPNGPISVDGAGNIYVSKWCEQMIWKLSCEGKPVTEFQIAAPRGAGFSELGGVAVDRSSRIYAMDSVGVGWGGAGIPSIQLFDPNGRVVRTWDVAKIGEGKIKYPSRIAMDGSGNMYITDQSKYCVHKLDAQGKYIKSWGDKGTGDGQFDTPEGIAVDGSGHVYVCDRQNCRIQKFDSDGKFLTKWGKAGSGDGEFHFPAAVAVDNEGNVFVDDSDNHRVQKFTADGKYLTKWGQFGEGPGQFNVPLGIAVDEAGNVYVSDSHNQRIQKFAPVLSH
jgi:tripartite motif-containing protein 71